MARAKKPAAAVAILRDEVCELDDSFRPDYSGRGMFGRECVGIVTDDPTRVVEEAAARGIRGHRRDSMGRSTIVYWPHLAAPTGEA